MNRAASENIPELTVAPDTAGLSRSAVEEFCRTANAAIAERGRFAVALSGGNTPRAVYALLAEQHKDSLPWERIFVFFGDERHVPPGHPDSNYRTARESLLARVPIPLQNVFRIQAELPAEVAAQQYEDKLREFFKLPAGAWPQFDLIFLGLGDDGHTASLFPGTAALREDARLVVANWVEKFKTSRITFTLPLLNHAAEVVFLVSGAGKARAMQAIFRPSGNAVYPAQMVRPLNGKVLWIADHEAASLL